MPDFRPGDRVFVRFAGEVLSAVVVEDRGEIGVGGRRLLRIRVSSADGDGEEFEVPAIRVEHVKVWDE